MFFRKATDSSAGRRPSARGTSDAQLKELRNKARRRLIGALALVLAAVIIVPPLFDSPPPPEPREPIVVPSTASGLLAMPGTDPAVLDPARTTADTAAPDLNADVAESTTEPAQTTAAAAPPAAPPAEPASSADASASQAEKPGTTPPPPPPPAPAAAKPAPKPDPIRERTDDGSVALALLAGKTPTTDSKSTPAPAEARGSFILQVAAYTTEQDARQRRDSLVEAGVTNAYVERGQSGDKTVYRLRVGPFPTHEAAQAAQTRLRALGYQNGLISGK